MSEKLTISFKHVPELLEKVEKIKAFAIQNAIKCKEEFNKRGIKFTELNEYGVAINIDELSGHEEWFKSREGGLMNFIKELET